jgi:hypothetical protein
LLSPDAILLPSGEEVEGLIFQNPLKPGEVCFSPSGLDSKPEGRVSAD